MTGKSATADTATTVEIQFQIGTKLKHLRLLKGLRLSDLAEKAECSESLLSKIENGRAAPSLSLLHRLATSLDTTVAWLFTSENQVPRVVMRAAERPSIELESFRKATGTAVERLTPVFEGALLQARVFIVDPGGHSLNDVRHSGEELGYVVEGEVELSVDGETYQLEPGDAFQFRSEQSHGYRNTGSTVARIIWVNTPPTY